MSNTLSYEEIIQLRNANKAGKGRSIKQRKTDEQDIINNLSASIDEFLAKGGKVQSIAVGEMSSIGELYISILNKSSTDRKAEKLRGKV